MKKRWFRLMAVTCSICLLAVWLSGCHSAPTEKADGGPQEAAAWYEAYPLESREVTVWIDDRVAEGDGYQVIKITDPDEIALLTDNVKFQQWQKPEPAQKLAGLDYYYVQFNEQTTVGLYQEIAYGDVGSGAPDELGNLRNVKAEYFMPEGFLQVVQQVVATHLK